jgi:hypothetical protein
MRTLRIAVPLLAALSLLAACTGGGEDAVTVADNFWTALQNQDLETAKSYATEDTRESLTINEQASDQEVEVTLGEATEENGETTVETTIQTSGEGSSMTMPMRTILVMESGAWKVDVDRTMMSMFGGAMGEMMEGMKGAMEGMGEAMAEGMEEGMKETGETVQDSSEEMAERSTDSSSESETTDE